jgi:hypothetical protein
VNGGLTVDEPSGERWHLALELLEDGSDAVYLGEAIQVRRHVGWPLADGQVHIAVLDRDPGAHSRQVAQSQVDEALARVNGLIRDDPSFARLLDKYGVIWEYCGDDGSATWLIAQMARDGSVLWPDTYGDP